MKCIKTSIALLGALFVSFQSFSQENEEENYSNIQTYTPSKLLNQGQWDVKIFNNLYTETQGTFNGVKSDKLRENYFTTTLESFTGVSKNNRINVGLLLEYRSNTIGEKTTLSVLKFENSGLARSGLTSFAPAIKFQPIQGIGNFSIQSAFHIPLIKNESQNGVFLDQTTLTLQNRFFYDYTFSSNKWQIFTELNTEYNFGEESSFANNTFVFAPGVFLSYFPSDVTTVLGFAQHSQRLGDFTQDYSALGLGGKLQLSKTLNLEVLYSKFIRGNNTGLGESFNIGLRALF